MLNQAPAEGITIMEMTKEELIELIKSTVSAMNACPEDKAKDKQDETQAAAEAPAEETAEIVEEKIEEKIEETSETAEEKAEEKAEQKESDEDDNDEEKEVIKIEALNSCPQTLGNAKAGWEDLHGEEFFAWLRKHPEVKN